MPIQQSALWRPQESLADAFSSREIALLDRLRLRVAAALRSHRSGSRRSRQRGRSGELIDYRQYAEGDELRDLDWNAFARHETLLTRIFADEISLPLHVFLDVSASMRFPTGASKLWQSTRLAGAAARIAASSETPTVLHTSKGQGVAMQRSRNFAPFLSGMQSALDEGRVGELADNLREAQRSLQHAMVVVLTDGYEGEDLLAPLRFLKQRHCEVYVLHVLSRFELAPNLAQDLTLVDAESGEEERVSDDPETLANYHRRLESFLALWRQQCRASGMGYALIDAGESLENQVSKGLIKSGLATRKG